MLCTRCAALTHSLTFDPNAEPRGELMSGSCIWPDEVHRDWCIKCVWKLRSVFHLRHQLTLGTSVSAEELVRFQELENQFPNWPLFRPERRSPDIAERAQHLVLRTSRECATVVQRMDRAQRD